MIATKDTIKSLLQMQERILEKDIVLEKEKDLPEKIENLKKNVESIREDIDRRRKIAKEKQAHIKVLQLEVDVIKDKISKYKTQQENVKTNKDYDLLTSQIEHEEEGIHALEEEIYRVNTEIDMTTYNLEGENGLQDKLSSLEIEYEDAKKKLEFVRKETRDQICDIQDVIEELRESISRENRRLLRTFDTLKHRVNDPISMFSRGSCSGCSTSVPASQHIHILQGRLHICESCGRIVISDTFQS